MNNDRLARLTVAFAIFVAAGILLRGYTTDDTYIHLRYAQNLLERGEFSFNPGESTYGATSPLWIFGLTVLLRAGLPPFASAWLLGVLSGMLMLLTLDALLDRLRLPRGWRGAVLVLAAADAWFLRWSYSGMETPLATALLVVLLMPLIPPRRTTLTRARFAGTAEAPPLREQPARSDAAAERTWMQYLAWGVAAGLAGLVRPEFILLGPAALPWLLWSDGLRRSPLRLARKAGLAVTGIAVVLGPWLAYAWLTFGRLTPGTATAKSQALSLAPSVLVPYLTRSVAQLAATQGPIWLAWLVFLLLVIFIGRRATHAAAEAIGAESRPLYRGPQARALVGTVATWSVVLIGGYAVNQVWIISRYLAPLSPTILVALAVLGAGLRDRMPAAATRRRVGQGILVAGIVATVGCNAWLMLTQVRPHATKFPVGLRECYLGMGDWLNDNTADDTVVAALDIGAIGFASDRYVLDLMGLVSPEIMALGRRLGFEAMVSDGSWLASGEPGFRVPEYFVDRAEGEPRWAGKRVRGYTFDLLDTCIIEGVGLREPQPWTVALYRLTPGTSRD